MSDPPFPFGGVLYNKDKKTIAEIYVSIYFPVLNFSSLSWKINNSQHSMLDNPDNMNIFTSLTKNDCRRLYNHYLWLFIIRLLTMVYMELIANI